ncbi:hypothetical protein WMY93_002534 [Mugilogobius chulae]|uniref:Integrase catalytic domain-containing protein n=1 Tax=Mugilogobius chulae TaxID=88201 RepID=A0AAW0PVQ3_9GOBI
MNPRDPRSSGSRLLVIPKVGHTLTARRLSSLRPPFMEQSAEDLRAAENIQLMGPGGLVLTSSLLWALGWCPVAAGDSAPGADSSSDDAAFGPSVPAQCMGAAKLLRSDCGTNFVSACKELQIDKQGCHNEIDNFLKHTGCRWQFNPPHASHMAGSWERMIGITRKILDAMLLEDKHRKLTHEVLVTLMAEVTAIVNARPLTAVSTDPDNPAILTPAMLLTQKAGAPPVPPGQFDSRDLFRAQWRRVQRLANVFWS